MADDYLTEKGPRPGAEDFPEAPPEGEVRLSAEELALLNPPRSVRAPALVAMLAALAGVALAGRSTSDFVAHLDRQVHAIHCSVSPGAAADIGETGCKTAMLSAWSSWYREDMRGGLPVSLLAMAVFAFLAYRSAHLLIKGRATRQEGAFLFASWLLPSLMSAIYGYLAVTQLGTTCQVCVGMYVASGVGLAAGLLALLLSQPPPLPDGRDALRFGVSFVEGCAFVGVFTLAYLAWAPDGEAAGRPGPKGCGTLVEPGDPSGIMVTLKAGAPGAKAGGPTRAAVEVLDPLCPSCRAFSDRLAKSGLGSRLALRGVLFPLDATCNWMVPQSLHPGACAVSEAMLCLPDRATDILDWAFASQDELLALGRADEAALRTRLRASFPALGDCLGSAQVKNKLTKSLRWAVTNALPVMTPQLFIEGTRLCDEDSDLGLEYTLARMIGAAPGAPGGGR